MESMVRIVAASLFYVGAALLIGAGVRVLVVADRARPPGVPRFRSADRFGLFSVCGGVGAALVATGALLGGWPRVTLTFAAVAISLALIFVVSSARRRPEPKRAEIGQRD